LKKAQRSNSNLLTTLRFFICLHSGCNRCG
jgi:hypothetical protein